MQKPITILGYGPVGRAAADILRQRGDRVRVAQRTRPAELPASVEFRPCDVLDAESVRQAVEGSGQVLLAVGFAYDGKVWQDAWPRAMANVLAACQAESARLVFVDNLYMYGPQTAPLREDMALASYGVKPAARSAVTRQWMAASTTGKVPVAALRGPDFYGPGVTLSHLGDSGFAAIGKGKRAVLIAPPDTPHDFAYVPDFGRAVVTLLDAPDDCFGQAWHVPCAPTRTPREILELGAQAIGVQARISSLPLSLVPAAGLFVPFMKELVEMRFTWDRPYHVDATKFTRRFWSDVTPFEVGAAETARSFLLQAGSMLERRVIVN
jgi:nucleoside-diphosphate-sugar epimerase